MGRIRVDFAKSYEHFEYVLLPGSEELVSCLICQHMELILRQCQYAEIRVDIAESLPSFVSVRKLLMYSATC